MRSFPPFIQSVISNGVEGQVLDAAAMLVQIREKKKFIFRAVLSRIGLGGAVPTDWPSWISGFEQHSILPLKLTSQELTLPGLWDAWPTLNVTAETPPKT